MLRKKLAGLIPINCIVRPVHLFSLLYEIRHTDVLNQVIDVLHDIRVTVLIVVSCLLSKQRDAMAQG